MDVFKDERFKHVAKDPKFRNVPKKDRKVKIDKRFEAMFTDEKFKLKYTVDRRGRPVRHSQAEDLKKYYDLSDSDPENQSEAEGAAVKSTADSADTDSDDLEGIGEVDNTEETDFTRPESKDVDDASILTGKVVERLKDTTVDYARGEGLLESDSSSSDEPTTEDSEEEIEHDWGELDKDAEQTDKPTNRLAVCHMDWDRVSATDIMVLLHSFLPPGGFIHNVTIYPSEFGMERMKEEEMKGPQELTAKKLGNQEDKEDSDEDDEYHREKLRQYQMKRLKYYYAVAEFNSEESANKVYTECDRMEYESSATKLDLRFIPDDMTFDQEPKETCTRLPEAGKYKPRLFANSALQQEKVELTWDETDPGRVDLGRRLAQGAPVSEADLRTYLATSSEEEDDHSQDGSQEESDEDEARSQLGKDSKGDDISKYRNILAGIQKDEERKRRDKVEMEISWDLALDTKAKQAKEKQRTEQMTPFERMVDGKHKKHVKKESDTDNLLSDDELPSDEDLNEGSHRKGKKMSKRRKKAGRTEEDDSEDEEVKKSNAELELLLAGDDEESGRKHFSLKAIQEREAALQRTNGKKYKSKPGDQEDDQFKIDLKDERFGALFSSHLYNIDPADSHFRKTKAMQDIIEEKSKRRKLSNTNARSNMKEQKVDGPQLSADVSKLLSSVKRKVNVNT